MKKIILFSFIVFVFIYGFVNLKKELKLKYEDGPYILNWQVLLYDNGYLYCKGAGIGSWSNNWRLISRNVKDVWGSALYKGPILVYIYKSQLRWVILNIYTGKPYYAGFLYPANKLPEDFKIKFENFNTGSVILIYDNNLKPFLKVKVDIWGNKEYLNSDR